MVFAFVSLIASAPLVPPTLPPMVSSEFQSQVLTVETALSRGEFARAATLAKALPRLNFQMVWDDRKVPATYKDLYLESRDRALALFRREFRAQIKVVPPSKSASDLKIGFEAELATDLDSGLPAGVVTFDSTARPRIEGVIGLKRGKPLDNSTQVEVHNDVLYTLGAYFGLAKNVTPNTIMSPSIAGITPMPHGFGPEEKVALRQNLRVIDFLNKAIKEKKRVVVATSDVFMDPQAYEGEAIQGETVDVSVQLTNRGAGKLAYRIEGDCGCVVSSPPGTIDGNSTKVIPVSVDTKEFVTRTNRTLRVYTNDPKQPVQTLPITLRVVPRYRFLSPGGSAKNLDDGRSFDVFLALAEGSQDLGVRETRTSGLPAKVTYEKWEGVLPDPERGEADKPRKGYRFHIEMEGDVPPGRNLIGLDVATNSIEFPVLTFPMSVQSGVVAMPEELYMGELAKLPKKATVVLTRPGRPLKVKSATVDAKLLSVKVVPSKNDWEVRLEVTYLGDAPSGELFANVTVLLDDAKQPKVIIPVTATVR